ncbi:putative dTDP-glucose 4,6-dehydratase [Streptomyces aurantiacus JA 4570]|uniref:dTDP-glucose 4,6-dehydratase n=1 Tax=Streptomyces aurantiacus JA 4570 TaxID=1286094 RepID=S4AQY9_9ACTN|nr:putative dTDP-glucose 4,6-dehydratase [Streptomyces aurantiacus JA 4570]
MLVTGGAGFIGSCFVRTVLKDGEPDTGSGSGSGSGNDGDGDSVIVLDKLTYAGRRSNLPAHHPRLDFVQGDIRDRALLRKLLPGCDAVVHFAAESHVDRSLHSADAFTETNVLGSQVLFDACLEADVPRIVHVSTDEVYGSVTTGASKEDDPLLPNSPYAASKAASDLVARAYHRSHGLPVMVTRCANNYGPRQDAEKVIPHFVTRLLDGRDVPLYGDGSHVRQWLHVSDHCRALRLVLEKGEPGEIYNIGGGTTLTNRELTFRLLRLCGADAGRIRHVTDRKAHDLRYAVDDSKLAALGYRPGVPFDEGLARTVEWYRGQRDRRVRRDQRDQRVQREGNVA